MVPELSVQHRDLVAQHEDLGFLIVITRCQQA
jgi:hypothetical protein